MTAMERKVMRVMRRKLTTYEPQACGDCLIMIRTRMTWIWIWKWIPRPSCQGKMLARLFLEEIESNKLHCIEKLHL
jgi:hypothetical protein